MTSMPAATVPNTVSNASGLRTIPQGLALQQQVADAAAVRRQGGEDQRAEQSVLAGTSQRHAGESKRHDADEGEHAKPAAVEGLIDQNR